MLSCLFSVQLSFLASMLKNLKQFFSKFEITYAGI